MARMTMFALGVLLMTTAVSAADFGAESQQNWHQWRGPEANGVARGANPPLEWDAQTNIQWKVEIPGRGSASPIVWGDRVFLLTAIETDRQADGAVAAAAEAEPEADEEEEEKGRGRGGRRGGRPFHGGEAPTNYYQFVVLCFDRNTGDLIWQKVANEEVPKESLHPTNTYASASPTTDGERLYVSFGSYGIFCYDLDGELLWQRDLGDMQTRNEFGEGASPTIYGDSLVVNWDHEGQSFLTVLDAATGEPKWRVDRDESSTWNTPLVVEHAGRAQIITNASNRARSYDLETGELIWECGGQAKNPIPSPVARNGVAYCMTGFRGFALYAIPLDAKGDITDSSAIAWHKSEGTPYVSSPLLYDDLLYTTKGRDAILSCWNADTGELYFSDKRLPGLRVLYASPVAAGDRIYYTGRGGTTVVVRRGTEFEVLASNNLGEGIDASPAIVGSQILLRGEKHLYSIAAE